MNLNTWFSIVAFCQVTVKGIYEFVYLNFETLTNWFTCLQYVIERNIFRPTVFIDVGNRAWKYANLYTQNFKFELVCIN